MSRVSLIETKVKNLIDNHEDYNFFEFIRNLRLIHGPTMEVVSQDVYITPMRLFLLENGRFKKRPRVNELRALSKYYNVDYKLLKDKADQYLDSKEMTEQKCA